MVDVDPRAIARTEAHRDRVNRDRCAADVSADAADCTCTPDPARLELHWQGRSRMAGARRAAGQPLDAYDRQALDRYPPTTPPTTAAAAAKATTEG